MHVLFPDSPIHSVNSEKGGVSATLEIAQPIVSTLAKAQVLLNTRPSSPSLESDKVSVLGEIPSPPISEASAEFMGTSLLDKANPSSVSELANEDFGFRKGIGSVFLDFDKGAQGQAIGAHFADGNGTPEYWSGLPNARSPACESLFSKEEDFVEGPASPCNTITEPLEASSSAQFICPSETSLLHLLQGTATNASGKDSPNSLKTFSSLAEKPDGDMLLTAADPMSPAPEEPILPIGTRVDEILSLGKGRQRIVEEKRFLEAYLARKQQTVATKKRGNATPEEMEKRHRNNLASARFRAKKKMREQILEKMCRDLASQADVMANEVHFMRAEIKFLRNILQSQKGVSMENFYKANSVTYRDYSDSINSYN